IAELYVTKMEEWLAHQQRIYDKELTQYKAHLPKELASSLSPLSPQVLILENERLLQEREAAVAALTALQNTLQASTRETMAANLAREQSTLQVEQLRREVQTRLQEEAGLVNAIAAERREHDRAREEL